MLGLIVISDMFYALQIGLRDGIRPRLYSFAARIVSADEVKSSDMIKQVMSKRKTLTAIAELLGNSIFG